MDNLYIYLLLLLLLLLLLGISIYISISNKKSNTNFSIYDLKHNTDPNFNWHNPVSVSACQLYTFPNNNILSPTTNKDILDLLPFNNKLLSPDGCLDQDQVYVQLSTRLCGINEESTCIGYDGTIYQAGTSEIFYNYCNIQYCSNSIIGSIATNFHYDPNDLNGGFLNTICFSHDGNPDNMIDGKPCDINDNSQFFRIYRVDAPINPTFNNNPTSNLSGQYLRIVQRDTSLCVTPQNNVIGSPLILKNCLSLPNNGYVWLLVPSININANFISPQQLVYSPSLFKPLDTKDLLELFSNPFNSLSVRGESNPFFISLIYYTIDITISSQNTQILDKRNYPIMSGNFVSNPKYPPSTNPDTFINFQYYNLQPTL